MILIKLTDNNYPGEEFSLSGFSDDEQILVRKALDEINNVSVKDLADRGLIIFPSQSAQSDLDDDQKTILTVQKLKSDTPTIKINTSNIMGFFSVDGVRFEIRSRFDSGDQQFFLHYMLQKVCNEAPTTKPTGAKRDKFYDFIVYLFPWYLKKAVAQGLFRAYIRRDYNDSNIRGAIDFPRHFRYNIPFNGKIAYRTREYSHDNSITQLVRHTIEFIAENHNLRGILAVDKEMRDAVQLIRGTTESYNRFSRESVIHQNLRTNPHPYYTEYEPLRKLCISILTHEKRSFGDDSKNELSGILFDGAALWEEYLAKVFEEKHVHLIHSNNRTGTNGIQIFQKGHFYYPDFYSRNSSDEAEDGFILDAKYKKLCVQQGEEYGANDKDDSVEEDPNGKITFLFQSDDLFQMLKYMYALKVKKAALISPFQSNSEEIKKSTPKIPYGYGGAIFIFAFPIPSVGNDEATWEDFKNKMKTNEEKIINSIENEKTGNHGTET